jgi:hypothetical protein
MSPASIHPLVTQLRFARSEFVRCLEGVSPGEGVRRFEPMNCISWMVGHLASQENHYWVWWAQGGNAAPGLNRLVGYGQPPSTPPLDEMWAVWRMVTVAADEYLDTLTVDVLPNHFERDRESAPEAIGTMLLRNIYHYWFHLGEGHAVRQQLGHTDLPQFVGDMSTVLYQPAAG